MAPRRTTSTSDTLSPQDHTQATSSQSFPRSNSPVNGFTNFLSKPSKWFTRSASNPKISSVASSAEPRASSSSGRKHKISRPTDPRPILDTYSNAIGTRSVMDLSSRNANPLDISAIQFNASQPSSPSSPQFRSAPLGDLRAISKRGWSRSADDLSKISTTTTDLSPSISMEQRIAQYRNRSNSNSTPGTPPSAPPLFQRGFNHGSMSPSPQPFPTISMARSDSSQSATSYTSAASTTPTVSISISAPAIDESAPAAPPSAPPSSSSSSPKPPHTHIRSHSFTPKLAAKLSAPRFMPASPKRKGSAGSDMTDLPPSPSLKGAFSFNANVNASSSSSSVQSSHQPTRRSVNAAALLAPPMNLMGMGGGGGVLDPLDTNTGSSSGSGSGLSPSSPTKRSSQIVYNSGFINKFVDNSPSSSHAATSTTAAAISSYSAVSTTLIPTSLMSHSASSSSAAAASSSSASASATRTFQFHSANLTSSKAWKPFKVELKGSKLYFYKPPSDRIGGAKELFPIGVVHDEMDDLDGGGGAGEGERDEGGEWSGGGSRGDVSAGLGRASGFLGGPGMGLGGGADGADDDPFAATSSPASGARIDMRSRQHQDAPLYQSVQRKKRAFWGRRTHPDLILGVVGEGDVDAVIEKGTFEALTHEAVFGTTFFGVDDDGEEGEEGGLIAAEDGTASKAKAKALEQWKLFASSILLALPHLVDQTKFEAELMRCCEYLVTGAAAGGGGTSSEGKGSDGKTVDDVQTVPGSVEKARVVWLTEQYLAYHGRTLDFPDWPEWKEIALAGYTLSPPGSSATTTIFGSASTRGMFNPSAVASPNVGMFSPRPEDVKESSLMDALGGSRLHTTPKGQGQMSSSYFDLTPGSTPTSKQHQHQGYPHSLAASPSHSHLHPDGLTSSWASALDHEGLSRDVLLRIDPHVLARSLSKFHAEALQRLPRNITADFVLKSDSSSAAPLFGSDEHPHWLTKLLLVQILGADTSTGYANAGSSAGSISLTLRSPALGPLGSTTVGGGGGGGGGGASSTGGGRKSEDRTVGAAATSRTHSRSEVISAWIKIGELCLTNGDECSWRAIMSAVCSMPVARLEKAWKRVEPQAVAVVDTWVQLVKGEDTDRGKGEVLVDQSRITPWGGDLKSLIREELGKAVVSGPGGDVLIVRPLSGMRMVFERFRTAVSSCPRKNTAGLEEKGEEDVLKLVSYWRDIVADGGVSGGLAMKFQRVDQFMSLSLAAEPRRKGLYEPFYWTKSSNHSTSTAPLLPLLFPEPLPTITLLDRSQLARGRVDSETKDIQLLRAVDGHLRPDDRKPGPGPDGAFAVLNKGGTTIPVYNGDLLLVVQNPSVDSSSTGSRPSSLVRSRPPSAADLDTSFLDGSKPDKPMSRTPSIRVKPGSSAGLERKSSLAKRSSLPSLSQRQPLTLAENSSEPPLRVLVQAGTLDRLVGALVHGLHNVSVSVADDNGEMSLRVGMTRELLLDHKEFSRVWWNVFRSFVTPLIFFELLRKIYIKIQPSGSPPLPDQYLTAISSKSHVLETIKLWLTKGGGAQDALDDAQLFQALRTFFASPSDHIIHFASTALQDTAIRLAWDALNDSREALERLLRTQTMRPSNYRSAPASRSTVTTSESRVRNLSTREPPDLDRISPEEFVDNIDGMAFAAFNNVTEEDLYITTDLLEVQSADRTGWFPSREPLAQEDQVEIQTIHSYLQEIDPSSLISELSPESLYRLLPPGIRSCIRAHSILRKWIISKVVAPRLGLYKRQSRLEFLLQVIEVARLRNADSLSPDNVSRQACVRSFVEAAVTSAILSPECRMHQRAWQNIAVSRGCNYETLVQLLARPTVQSISSKDPLTVDMGWLIERVLDVIAMPDLVESHNEEGLNLVNFDKRRNLCNFISNAPSLLSRRLAHQSDINRRGFERLNNIEREIFSIQFDLRGIKDEAYRESTANPAGTPSRNKISRPFQKLIAAQLDKLRRDKNLRVRLQKEKMQEQSRNEKREEQLNRAMRGGRRPTSVAQKQHRNKKSMSSLFSFMRPISSAFGADTSHTPTPKRTAAELDFVPSGKPTLVLNLTDSHVAQFINNDRSFTFQLDTEDGGHYLLQTMSKREMNKWIETLSQVSKTAAKRRLTYIGNSPKPQVSDHLHERSVTATRDPTAVFGVELDFLLQRENGDHVLPGIIPSVIERCIAEVETRGLTEVGIYRIAGATSVIASLKEAFNRGEDPLDDSTDVHAICDLIKSWFRTLPEPMFPPSSYHEAIETMKLENLDDRLTNIREIIHNLPRANFDLLKRISEHLDKVTDFEEQNQMTAEALSIVFSPNLLRAPHNDFLMVLSNMPFTHKLVKALVTHYHVIFDESDVDAEADPEDELDSPIAEVDEDDEPDGEFANYVPVRPNKIVVPIP
ncbi:hypothetical protein D9757_009715 [Collybiopsis confluens]|uniref:Uncharacterized protein n=1 Tax=Collybiopsis confluens TaxID=2823264 RepID=A0A8H5H638_9AGAR|nr:hypothetical protein D9757_009715 [Collybiopsis confluens]